MNVIAAENEAIEAIEEIFKRAGWSDGWGMNDVEVMRSQSPLFYRNATGAAAERAQCVASGGKAQTLYCIYNIATTESKYAENHPYGFDVTICLTFYYSDPFLFHEKSEGNPYIDRLMKELADALWVIASEGEQQIPPTEDRQAYLYRKMIFATNFFN